jgi:hypothetical protein
VRQHVRRVLEALLGDKRARLQRALELEGAGHRIVGGGQTGPDSWEIYDWRTNRLIAKGETTASRDTTPPPSAWTQTRSGFTATTSATTCRSRTWRPRACPRPSDEP